MKPKTYTPKELVDRKVLFINTAVNKFIIHEGKINEFSPTGKCIKINHEWHLLEKISILELFTDEERPGLRFV
jgi:hypothetical protein